MAQATTDETDDSGAASKDTFIGLLAELGVSNLNLKAFNANKADFISIAKLGNGGSDELKKLGRQCGLSDIKAASFAGKLISQYGLNGM